MKFSKYLLIQILVLLFTTALFAEESALESNKKPIPNEGRLTEAVDALENAKSENDSVKGSVKEAVLLKMRIQQLIQMVLP